MDKVVHFHLPVNDMDRAKNFYEKIFGWEIKETNGEYQLVKTVETDEEDMPLEPGAINGALYKRTEQDDSTEITIEVSSIDNYLKKIEESGGKIVTPKTPVMEYGFYAEFSDSEGNFVGLWENA